MSRKDDPFTMIINSEKQIQFMFNERQKLTEQIRNSLLRVDDNLSSGYINSVKQRIDQYVQIKGLIQMLNNKEYNTKGTQIQYSKFWSLNESIERDVEDRLRKLKEMDSQLDIIINEEFSYCSEIENIEQSIRQILLKKQVNHIKKADSFLQKKTMLLNDLQVMKQQKEQVKQNKLITIRQLLKLLQKLKTHRDSKISTHKDKKLTPEEMNLLMGFVRQLSEVTKKREDRIQIEERYKKLQRELQYTTERIHQTQVQLFQMFTDHSNILSRMNEIKRNGQEFVYLQTELYQKIGMHQKDIYSFVENITTFMKQESLKKQEFQQLTQAVKTTNQTIQIFKHIQESIQTENRRKLDLLQQLQSLQKQYKWQTEIQQKIMDQQNDLAKIMMQKQRLNKKLSNTVDQADVNAYKNINRELEDLQTNSTAKEIIIKDMRQQWREKSKQLLIKTNNINDDFKDILSQVVPQVWFRDHDFSKEQTIKDLNLYLIKTFNRLNKQ